MGRPISIQLPKQEIIDMYCSQKLHCTEIAKKFNTNPEVIRLRLKSYGIDTSTNKHSEIRKGPRFKDLTNQKFGDVIVTHLSHQKTYSCKGCKKKTIFYWSCKCKCGKVLVRTLDMLTKNAYNGCRQCNGIKIYDLQEGCGGVTPGLFSKIEKRANKIKKGFDLTPEFLWQLFKNQNGKCALSGVEITLPIEMCKTRTSSLDRIDSSKGYVQGNVQWVHKQVNLMKHTMLDNELIDWCTKIVKYNKEKSNG